MCVRAEQKLSRCTEIEREMCVCVRAQNRTEQMQREREMCVCARRTETEQMHRDRERDVCVCARRTETEQTHRERERCVCARAGKARARAAVPAIVRD